MKKYINYGQKEKALADKYFLLFGTKKLRNGKVDKVFCQVCEHSNDVQCMYDIMAAQGEKMGTKYPCGKAFVKYQEQNKK
jgi:hypothetical protein